MRSTLGHVQDVLVPRDATCSLQGWLSTRDLEEKGQSSGPTQTGPPLPGSGSPSQASPGHLEYPAPGMPGDLLTSGHRRRAVDNLPGVTWVEAEEVPLL